jgi:hypothetical protein
MVNGWVSPDSNNSYGLGTSSTRWNSIYTTDLNVSGTCTGCGGLSGATSPITYSSGTVACATCLVSASGKKLAGGFASFSSGTATISTGLSSIDYVSAITSSASLTPSEYIGYSSNSGGSLVLKSSNSSSGGFFFWMAVGNP